MAYEIPVFFSPHTFSHRPQVEVHRGDEMMHADQVGRAESILVALTEAGYDARIVKGTVDVVAVLSVHTPEYLAFLSWASNQVSSNPKLDTHIDGGVPAVYPSTLAFTENRRHRILEGVIGEYAFDTYTPITAATHQAALSSAVTALSGARHLLTDGGVVYALTRPPGHHAMKDKMGGYCYLNNAAIAAEFFIRSGVRRVTIFDPDLHHGNGIQQYAWDRPDVQYVSIHADPSFCYPFYTGYADERGGGKGKGTIVNYPLPKGTKEGQYHAIVKQAVNKIRSYKPDVLIVAAGFDTHKDDPFQTFGLSTRYYRTLARELDHLDVRTLILQEGGYNVKTLGANVVSFLSGFSMK